MVPSRSETLRTTLVRGMVAVTVLLAAACGDERTPTQPFTPRDPEPQPKPEPLDTITPVYAVPPPEGKLPWPQHDPASTQAQYDTMLAQLWVVNNFGLCQGTADRYTLCLHDGLDIVLPTERPSTRWKPEPSVRTWAEASSTARWSSRTPTGPDRPGAIPM